MTIQRAATAFALALALALVPIGGAASEPPSPPPPEGRATADAPRCGAACVLFTAAVAEGAIAGWSALAASHPGETGVVSMLVSPFGCVSGARATEGAPYLCGALFAGMLGVGLWAATGYSDGSLSSEDRFWRGAIAWNVVAAASTTAYLLRDRAATRGGGEDAGARPRLGVAPVPGGAAVLLAGEF